MAPTIKFRFRTMTSEPVSIYFWWFYDFMFHFISYLLILLYFYRICFIFTHLSWPPTCYRWHPPSSSGFGTWPLNPSYDIRNLWFHFYLFHVILTYFILTDLFILFIFYLFLNLLYFFEFYFNYRILLDFILFSWIFMDFILFLGFVLFLGFYFCDFIFILWIYIIFVNLYKFCEFILFLLILFYFYWFYFIFNDFIWARKRWFRHGGHTEWPWDAD